MNCLEDAQGFPDVARHHRKRLRFEGRGAQSIRPRLIAEGDEWMATIESRNQTSHSL